MRSWLQIRPGRPIEVVFLLLAIVYVVLAVIGGFRGFSPVPFWDMWDGYLGFYVNASQGQHGAWWAQHNEHRIVLARLLFWIDHALFRGLGRFLVVANYLLIAAVCAVFLRAWREQNSGRMGVVAAFLVAWLCSWTQQNNLTWGFQSQFILAQWLPLLAFWLLHRSAAPTARATVLFAAAAGTGLLAIGSMANGVLTLPLMAVMASLMRTGWRRVAVLAGLAVLGVGLYFHGYVAPGKHGALSQALRDNPTGLVRYVLTYLGSPFAFMGGRPEHRLLLAQGAGAALLVGAAAVAWRTLRSRPRPTLPLALLSFILYVGGTALGTAGGRLIFGIDQALSSRYLTPALMAWAALVVMVAPGALRVSARAVQAVLLVLLLALLPSQWHARKSQNTLLFDRQVAALALELGVQDDAQIANVFPDARAALDLARVPVARNLSVFGQPDLADRRERVGLRQKPSSWPQPACRGALDDIQPLRDDPRFVRVRGWLADPAGQAKAHTLSLATPDGQTLGFASSGQSRPDVGTAVGPQAGRAGYLGYVRASAQGQTVVLVSERLGCQLSVRVPVLLFQVRAAPLETGLATVPAGAVLDGHGWTGADFQRSRANGLQILGSFVQSDADTGSLQLRLRRGDRLFFRSGPSVGRQTAEALGTGLPPAVLPVAADWVLLEFNNSALPADFTLRLSDGGDGWGEWSAVGLVR